METTERSSLYSKENPFPACLRENRLLNKEGSAKETRHFVVDLRGSGLSYSVGDSLGIYPTNDPSQVEAILGARSWTGEEPVVLKDGEPSEPFRAVLENRISLAAPSKATVKAFAEAATDAEEKAVLENLLERDQASTLKQFLADREFIDLLQEFPSVEMGAEAFSRLPRKLVPRLYSIASSPLHYPEEVHLTVATVRYRTNNRDRIGVASTYLSDRSPIGASVPSYIAESHFRLPEDPSTDIIMVGPGTGIAPFRAFLQEREKQGTSGRNWLFFGDQHKQTDFLYGEEFERFQADGLLHRMDLAFSRDQDEKIYVQHRMLERAAELWSWLEKGASFYVCGDASRMAKDVDDALLRIVQEEGGYEEREAKNFLRTLRKEKRYQRDVY